MKSIESVSILVWDERQPEQKPTYPNFLGNHIANHLSKYDYMEVTSVGIDDPDWGLATLMEGKHEILIWWGHRRHDEITSKMAQEIVKRIQAGKLSLIALHSAHYSTPFMEAMAAITRERVESLYLNPAPPNLTVEYLPYERKPPKGELAMAKQPWSRPYKYPDGRIRLEVQLPNCCFPAWQVDGKPSYFTTLQPTHSIADYIPHTFTLPQTEMYAEPFHVPEPNMVIFEERWESGHWFRSGCTWELGKGDIFYFRPGHETYDIFQQAIPLKIIENAINWMGYRLQNF